VLKEELSHHSMVSYIQNIITARTYHSSMESTTTESTTTESTTTGGIRKVGDGETKNRNSSALAQFAKYLEMRFDGKKRYKELIDSDINVELFQCFGGFLIDHAVHGTTKKPLTLGTAWQYLSDTKTALTKRFKRNELLSSSNELWYKDVRAAVSKHIIKRCIAQGVRISEKTSPVGKELMKRIGEYIIHRASDFSEVKKYSLYNLYLVFTFAAVGRVSEAMFASYNNAMWHCDGYLTFDWTELKVASIKTMNFFPDYSCLETCVFFAYSMYWMSCTAADLNGDFVFPDLALTTSSASQFVSKLLKQMIGKVPGVTKETTGKGLRVGAATDIASSQSGGIFHAIMRGGWDFSGECSIFEYIMGLDVTIAVGGKILSGYSNPRNKIYPPECVFINNGNREQVMALIETCYPLTYPEFGVDGCLFQFKLSVFATFLMRLPSFVSKYTAQHAVVCKFKHNMMRHHFTWNDIMQWSAAIEEEWLRLNFVDTRNVDEIYQENRILRDQIQQLHRKCDTQTIAIADLHKKLDTAILEGLKNIPTDTTIPTSETVSRIPTSPTVLPPITEGPSKGPSTTTTNVFQYMRVNMQRMPHISFIQYKTLEKLCLSTVIIDYFDYELHEIVGKRYPMVDNVNKQKKLNRVLTKGLGLLYDDEKRFLDEPKPCMASQSTSYREWKSNLKCIAEKVELRVIVDLFGQENYDKFHPKKKASKKYINSIYDAMSARRDSDGNIIPRTKKRKLQSDVSNL